MRKKNCPYCRSEKTKTVFASNGSPVNRCRDCDLIFRQNRGNERDWVEYYRHHYFQAFRKEQEELLRAGIYEEALRDLERYTTKGTLFDIGAGSGTFLAMARRKGWTVSGQELSSDSCRVARERYGLGLMQRELQDLPWEPQTHDAITVINVLDHLMEPWVLLEQACTALKPRGALYIRIPNGNLHQLGFRLAARFSNPHVRDKIGRFFVLHLYHMTPRFMERILKDLGFERVILRPSVVSSGLPYPCFTRGQEVIVSWMKGVSPFLSRIAFRLSGEKFVMSPSMNIFGVKP